MKRIALLCSILLYLGNIYAQETEPLLRLIEIKAEDGYKRDTFFYNSDNQMINDRRTTSQGDVFVDEYSYEGENLVKIVYREQTFNDWENLGYDEFSYDEAGNRVTYYGMLTHRLGGVLYSEDYVYFYENNQRIGWEAEYEYGYDQRGFLYYDEEGRIVEEVIYNIIDVDTLGEAEKHTYEYDSEGNLIRRIEYSWEDGAWDVLFTDLFYYDAYGNCVKWEFLITDYFSKKEEYDYDLNYSIDEIIMPLSQENDEKPFNYIGYVNKLDKLHQYSYDRFLGDWVFKRSYEYIYKSPEEPIDDDDDDDDDDVVDELPDGFVIFPNPADQEMTVNYKDTELYEISIYDVAGTTVLRINGEGQERIDLDISLLPSGVYVLRAHTAEGVQTKKFMVAGDR